MNEVRAFSAGSGIRKGWFSNTSFTTGLIFALKKTRASGRNVGKVFNPVVKLVLENQPFLSHEHWLWNDECLALGSMAINSCLAQHCTCTFMAVTCNCACNVFSDRETKIPFPKFT